MSLSYCRVTKTLEHLGIAMKAAMFDLLLPVLK